MKIPTNGPSRIYESPVRMGVKGQRGAWERGTTSGGNGWEQECGGALDQRWPLDHFTEGQLVQQGRTTPPSPSPSRHNPQKKALFTHWAGEGGSKEGAICEERRILVTAQLPHPLCSTTLLFQSSPRALGNRNVCVREERIRKGYLWTSQGCCIKQDVACVRALGTGLCVPASH